MAKSPQRLGKGLSALIGPRTSGPFRQQRPSRQRSQVLSDAEREPERLRELPIESIGPNPQQPRARIDQTSLDELAASIKQSGVLQPIIVRETEGDEFQVVAGERRWRAAKLAGLKTIPAIVHDLTDAEAFEIALIENLQREDLDPLERANAYQQLIDTSGVSVDVIATKLGESRANIANYLRLLRLDDEVQALIGSGELGMGQARAIAGISNPQRQLAVARMSVRRNLSVRQVEDLARKPEHEDDRQAKTPSAADHHLAGIAETLSKSLGLGVTLNAGKRKNSGRVVIRYNSLEEFDRIAEKIAGRSLME